MSFAGKVFAEVSDLKSEQTLRYVTSLNYSPKKTCLLNVMYYNATPFKSFQLIILYITKLQDKAYRNNFLNRYSQVSFNTGQNGMIHFLILRGQIRNMTHHRQIS